MKEVAGAKQIIEKYAREVFSFSEGVIDIDTPGDYARLTSLGFQIAIEDEKTQKGPA